MKSYERRQLSLMNAIGDLFLHPKFQDECHRLIDRSLVGNPKREFCVYHINRMARNLRSVGLYVGKIKDPHTDEVDFGRDLMVMMGCLMKNTVSTYSDGNPRGYGLISMRSRVQGGLKPSRIKRLNRMLWCLSKIDFDQTSPLNKELQDKNTVLGRVYLVILEMLGTMYIILNGFRRIHEDDRLFGQLKYRLNPSKEVLTAFYFIGRGTLSIPMTRNHLAMKGCFSKWLEERHG